MKKLLAMLPLLLVLTSCDCMKKIMKKVKPDDNKKETTEVASRMDEDRDGDGTEGED